MAKPGRAFVIMNTVQSAAVIADDICRKKWKECVEHLHCAMPEDRAETIGWLKTIGKSGDTNWVFSGNVMCGSRC